MNPMRLLIAVDGSEHARRAIHAAATLADHGCNLQVVLLHVREPLPAFGPEMFADLGSVEAAQCQRQNEVLAEGESLARQRGLTLLPACRALGDPADEILARARDAAVDQIVMGTRGLGALRSLLLGSVAQRVLLGAQVPVLLAH